MSNRPMITGKVRPRVSGHDASTCNRPSETLAAEANATRAAAQVRPTAANRLTQPTTTRPRASTAAAQVAIQGRVLGVLRKYR